MCVADQQCTGQACSENIDGCRWSCAQSATAIHSLFDVRVLRAGRKGLRSACAWGEPGPANENPVLLARPALWTRAPPTPPVAPWARPPRGHNAVTTLVHVTAESLDHTAETEVPGFIPSTDLRPADTLGNSHTAPDISICSPHAQQAGPHCTQSRLEAELAHCGPHLPSLLRQNISYTRSFGAPMGDPTRSL